MAPVRLPGEPVSVPGRERSRHDVADASAYDTALVAALAAEGVSVIAITDHSRVDSGESLRAAATAAGITVFPGFEATTKDGVHLLVLFDPGTSVDTMNRHLGACGIPAGASGSLPCNLDTIELLEHVKTWRGVAIAAHVTSGGGLLATITGQARARAWKDPNLHAAAYGGAAVGQAEQAILRNVDPAHKRENPIALLRAADISDPADVAKASATCWVKLSSLTIDGLDLAFRTPETRVRDSDPSQSVHGRVVGITWEGGFLDGLAIRLNGSLNVLIGGRGAGKSTVIETIRYAMGLAPIGKSAKEQHLSMVKNVLGSGAKVRLFVEVRMPSVARYVVERTVGHDPVVRDAGGTVLASKPQDVLASVEVYGQRELADLARDRESLTALLARYLPDPAGDLVSRVVSSFTCFRDTR